MSAFDKSEEFLRMEIKLEEVEKSRIVVMK